MMKRIAKGAIDAPVLPLIDAPSAEALRANRERRAALSGLEDELVDVLISALARLVEEELHIAPEHVRAVARSELHKLRDAQRVVLHVHPDDVALVTPLIEENSAVDIEADSSLARGDCLLDSELGNVDARIHTKLSRFAALLRESGAP